ncbi:MAG: sigma-70 family RNA polymerase sigma factor [Planctomycetota bacterium]
MARAFGDTVKIQQCLDRLREGDRAACEELVNHSCARLNRLAHRLLKAYPNVRRWEDTQDVCQNAAMRLYRALAEVHPDSIAAFMGLAATQIRRELIDLARHYMGPRGMGAHHRSDATAAGSDRSRTSKDQPAADTSGPSTLAEWTEFHRLVEELPQPEREVFDLHYYGGLPHREVAKALGTSEPTVRRRWQSARLLLRAALRGVPPGE